MSEETRQRQKESKKEYNKKYYEVNREKRRAYNQAWWKKHRTDDPVNRKRHSVMTKLWAHRERSRAVEIVARGEKPRCANCGCDLIEILEINHREGRDKTEMKPSPSFYHAIVIGQRKIDDLDILCKVCNPFHYVMMKYPSIGKRFTVTFAKSEMSQTVLAN